MTTTITPLVALARDEEYRRHAKRVRKLTQMEPLLDAMQQHLPVLARHGVKLELDRCDMVACPQGGMPHLWLYSARLCHEEDDLLRALMEAGFVLVPELVCNYSTFASVRLRAKGGLTVALFASRRALQAVFGPPSGAHA
jgi:hypothetical protein